MKKIPEPTLLDLYAGMAMISLIQQDAIRTTESMEQISKNAFAFAEQMLKQRTVTMKGKRDE
jgi:uncharacterized protein YqjF (DUF2071 family)